MDEDANPFKKPSANEVLTNFKAHEYEIVDVLEEYAKEFKKINDFYETNVPRGIKHKKGKELNLLKKVQHENIETAVRKVISIKLFGDYLASNQYGLNSYSQKENARNRIYDIFEGNKNLIEKLKKETKNGAPESIVTVYIPPENPICKVKYSSIKYLEISNDILVSGSNHLVDMSLQKAQNFYNSALKRSTECATKILEQDKRIKNCEAEYCALVENSKTEEANQQYTEFVETKVKPFEQQIASNLLTRVNVFLRNSKETDFMKKFRYHLRKGQEIERNKDPQNNQLISPQTIKHVLFAIIENDIILDNYKQKNTNSEQIF